MFELKKLLGLKTQEAENFLKKSEIDYDIIEYCGHKDKERLVESRVINVKMIDNKPTLVVSNFAESLYSK